GETSAADLECHEMETVLLTTSGQTIVLAGPVETKLVSTTQHRNAAKELADGEFTQKRLAETLQGEQEFEPLLLVRPEIVDHLSSDNRYTEYAPAAWSVAGSELGSEIERAQSECPCTCGSCCTNDCAAGSTSCPCGLHCSDCHNWLTGMTAPPVWLEVGRELDHAAMPEPYDVILTSFNLDGSPNVQPAFQFMEGVLR